VFVACLLACLLVWKEIRACGLHTRKEDLCLDRAGKKGKNGDCISLVTYVVVVVVVEDDSDSDSIRFASIRFDSIPILPWP